MFGHKKQDVHLPCMWPLTSYMRKKHRNMFYIQAVKSYA